MHGNIRGRTKECNVLLLLQLPVSRLWSEETDNEFTPGNGSVQFTEKDLHVCVYIDDYMYVHVCATACMRT